MSLPAARWARISSRSLRTRSVSVALNRGSAQNFKPTMVGVTASGGLHSAAAATAASAAAATKPADRPRARRVTPRASSLRADDLVPQLAVLLLVRRPD